MKKIVPLHGRPTFGEVMLQLGAIILVVSGSAIVFTLLGMLLANALTGVPMESLGLVDAKTASDAHINALKIIQLTSVIGIFILPAILVPIAVYKMPPLKFLSLHRRSSFLLFGLTLLAYYVLSPLLEWSITANQAMDLPAGLEGLERWMKEKEEATAELTERFLQMPGLGSLVFNLFFVALLPAVSEELFFRGLIQRSLFHWTRNIHFSIVVAVILFSAIHLQFYGFFPRMLLGMLFGYILFWTGDMKLPIFAHFLNNATAVVVTYLHQRGKIDKPIDEPVNYPIWIYVLSLVLGSYLLYSLYRAGRRRKEAQNKWDALLTEGRPWVKVFASLKPYEAEIFAGRLREEGIDAVVVNKRDSSYATFGQAEVHVPAEDEARALEIQSGPSHE